MASPDLAALAQQVEDLFSKALTAIQDNANEVRCGRRWSGDGVAAMRIFCFVVVPSLRNQIV